MLDLRNLSQLPAARSLTIAATGTLVEVKIDRRIARLSVRPITHNAKLVLSQTPVDGDAIGATEYVTLSADVWHELGVRRDRGLGTTALDKVLLTGTTGGRIELIVESAQ